jgi:hypothetical protein
VAAANPIDANFTRRMSSSPELAASRLATSNLNERPFHQIVTNSAKTQAPVGA